MNDLEFMEPAKELATELEKKGLEGWALGGCIMMLMAIVAKGNGEQRAGGALYILQNPEMFRK